jgi:hypothetical protein
MPIAVAGGIVIVVALIAYLIVQSAADEGGLSDWEQAQLDDSPDLPGVYIPPQGRGHFNYTYSPGRTPRPYCPEVRHADDVDTQVTPSGSATPGGSTPQATATPQATGTTAGTPQGSASPQATATPRTDCYASNPPSSGQHLGVQRQVDLGDGAVINIPGDAEVYPPDVIFPREAIAHFLEHAGVFIGYHCAEGDQACLDVVGELEGLVNDRIDNHNDRVQLANDPDLPVGEIGVAAWTRVMNFPYQDYEEGEVEDFIGTHSCRFDPENICR